MAKKETGIAIPDEIVVNKIYLYQRTKSDVG